MRHPPLAFVDLETTGLNPSHDRIVEIGIVTVDDGRVAEWSSFVNPGRRVSGFTRSFTGISDDMVADAPRFSEIAGDIRHRLDGRLFVAHNARFDHGFLKAEFERVAIEFEPDVICTVMLSRKLYPQFDDHNLDALMARHGLAAETRHRALPDARLIWNFWQTLHRDFTRETISATVDALLAQPVLPAHLDIGLIDRLPESPGVYVFCGEGDRPLQIGRAANLKQHLRNYFRLDRNCARAMRLSREIRDIKWRSTGGALGARLLQTALSKTLFAARKNPAAAACFLRLAFRAERRAVRAGHRRVARRRRLFRAVPVGAQGLERVAQARRPASPLPCAAWHRGNGQQEVPRVQTGRAGIALRAKARAPAANCPVGGSGCAIEAALLALPGTYRDQGAPRHAHRRSLALSGDGRSEAEAHALLQTRPGVVDRDIFNVLAKALPRLRTGAVARLARAPRPAPASDE